ncbi:MAG: OmpA family protein [Ignavibacteriaceae bacterium]|nr:OmpA family protein [Ignavibacteriaceae bacterium]
MELSYLTLANDMLDGLEGPLGGLLGGTRDAYMAFDIGLLYNFGRGPISKLSEIYGGVAPGTSDSKGSSVSLVQAYPGKPLFQNAWKFGGGFIYPRFAGTEAVGKEFNYGGYLSLERAFTEHMSGRMKPFYINVAEKGNNAPTNSVIGVGFDFLYKFVPCEPVVPYIGLGASSFYATVTNARSFKDESFLDYQINVLLGADWRFGEKFNVVTELGYYTVATDKFDGIYGSIGGLFGGAADSYMGFSLGINYILSNGPKSELCNLYSGIGIVKYIEKDPNTTDPGKTDPSQQGTTYEPIDYAKIEEIVKKYRQDPVDYEKIRQMIKENAGPGTSWILSGVNFDFASANLRPESYPILNNAAQVLMSNPSMRVEIQGHTDNIGTDATNRTLSQNRADAVKSYLVGRGIESNRMTTLGLGFSVPIASNATAEGRAMNRRVEFKVISK